MRATFVIAASVIGSALIGPAASAQDTYTAEVLSEAPPEELAPPIREALGEQGVRVLNAEGGPVVDFWIRRSIPSQGEVAGPSGAVLFPFLEVGQVVGAIRLSEEAGDYKDQSILPGVYTMRYGLQPVDGNHLGVSKFRDYFLLSLADEDIEIEPISQDDLQSLSTGPSGTNHPAVFLLIEVPQDATPPAIVRDDQADRTGLVLTIPVAAEGQAEPTVVPVQVVIEGAGPH